jgi:predicted NBD/HSP70 family sugar kinase
MRKRILVIDVGGTHVKLHLSGGPETVKLPSGPSLTPARLVRAVRTAATERGWEFDAVSLGVPAPVVRGAIVREPANLGAGWTRFDFSTALGKPLRLVNDAAMQALGSWRDGTMLFLGLGTGLGSALVVDGVLVPMELARFPYRGGELEDAVGERALRADGKRRWRRRVAAVVAAVAAAFVVDEVVLGGGNAARLKELPKGARLGSNALAVVGGERLWSEATGAQHARFAAPGRPRRAAGARATPERATVSPRRRPI